MKKLEESTTVYIGNLNLVSTESDVRGLFSNAGDIKAIIMGLDKKTLAPAGFCFVEYVKNVFLSLNFKIYLFVF